VLIKGPTGVGKTRFAAYMAARLGLPLYTVACHDDQTAADLVGRHLIGDGATYWSDGPLTRAVKDVDLEEVASTRLLVYAAILIRDGMQPVDACRAAIVEALTDDREVAAALEEVVLATFGQ
jgi:hypothetical protein